MNELSDQTHPSRKGLLAYVSAVTAGAVALSVAVAVLDRTAVHRSHLLYVAIFTVVLIFGETKTTWSLFGDGGEVTPGWAFAFGLVLLGWPTVAIVVMGLCTVGVDLRDRKPALKVVFNAAQISGSLALSVLVLRSFGVMGTLSLHVRLGVRTAVALLLAGITLYLVNTLLTITVLALNYRTTVRSALRNDFGFTLSSDGALLALSPLFVLSIQYSLMTMPLLGITAMLVYRSTEEALQRAHDLNHDGLTHLLNRRSFTSQLEAYLESYDDHSPNGALLLIDLDGFKEINDRLGHQIGDRVLQGVADKLTAAAPDGAVVSRLGGDEFAMLIPAVGDETATMALVEVIHSALVGTIDVEGFPMSVGMSTGVAMVPAHGRTSPDLLGAADVAMYRAKRLRTGVECYRTLGSRPERGRLGLLAELSTALARGQLKVHYQPMLRFADDGVDTIEALLRWEHPTLGSIPPGDFIALAEHTELIAPLTRYVLAQASADARTLTTYGIRLAVNVSARNIQDRRFPSSVLAALAAAGLQPGELELEITESAIASEPERSLYAIDALREAGIRVAIDDFGTGYSSFAMLRNFTVDRLKIDAGFVNGIDRSTRQQHLVRSIVNLAHGLGIEAVAEGVETEGEWSTLNGLHCDVAQGFLLSRPVPLHGLVRWLDQRDSLTRAHRSQL